MADRSVLVRLRADISDFQAKMMAAGRGAQSFANRLEQADSRMANLVQTGLALAPALVPIGGLAVPAIAGLSAQLGFAATAAGVSVLAFQGVGDALTALNKYQLEPTAANFAAMQEKMGTLGPAGQDFVRTLQALRPEMQGLQDIAQSGLFPGLTDGINEAMELMPEAESLIRTVSTTLGDLAAEAGDNLNDPRWVEFFGFLDREAGPTLEAMGKSFGNVVEGLANMMMAVDPLTDDFTGGMLNMSRSFNEWTQGLDSSQGFQDFLDYIQDTGPQALDTLGAIADALVSLVQAAAPVGAVTLPIIEGLADGLSAIADSPVGPLLIGTAAAVGVLGRSMALLKTVGLRGGTGESFLATMLAPDKIKAGAAALTTVTTAQDRARLSTAALAEAEAKRAATVRAGLVQAGKNAALLGGLAVATTGVADKAGLANTATFALMGTIAGPWGAAIGGGVGLAMDFGSAMDKAADFSDRLADSLNSQDLSAMSTGISQARGDLTAYIDDISAGNWQEALGNAFDPDVLINTVQALTGATTEVDKMREALAKQQAVVDDVNFGVNALGRGFGELKSYEATSDITRLTDILTRARPAMDALGISAQDLGRAAENGTLGTMVDDIVRWTLRADTAAGRTKALGTSVAGLGDDMLSTADSASALSSALAALLDPNMNLTRATDAWTTGLRELNGEIAKHNHALQGNSAAAIQNREAINGQIDNIKAVLAAEAEAGASPQRVAKRLQDMRDQLVKTGVAAGMSGKALRAFIADMGLTPKVVRTVFQAAGITKAEQQARQLKETYDGLPKNVRSDIRANGIPETRADITRLQKQYNLTPEQVDTLVRLMDQAAKSGITTVKGMLAALDRSSASPNVGADVGGALSAIATARAALDAINGRVATMFVRTIRGGFNFADGGPIIAPTRMDSGGPVRGPGSATSDDVPIMGSHGEFMMRAAAVEHYGLGTMFAMNALHLADGGPADDHKKKNPLPGIRRGFDLKGGMSTHDIRHELREFEKSMHKAGRGVGQAFDHLGKRAVLLGDRYEDTTNDLKNTRDQIRELRSGARDAYNDDAFGGGLSDFDLTVGANTNDANAAKAALRKAGKKGLDGPLAAALAASGNLTLAQEFARLSPAEIRRRERAYSARTVAQNQFASTAVDVSGLPQEVRHLVHSQNRLTKKLEHLESRIEGAVRKGAHDGTAQRDRDRNRSTSARVRTR